LSRPDREPADAGNPGRGPRLPNHPPPAYLGGIRYRRPRVPTPRELAMSVRVAINGFGRIGRNVLRAVAEAKRKDMEVIAINDLAPVETNAHLLRFDSVHGRFPGEVKVDGDSIDCGTGKIKVTAIKNPAELPW